MLGFGGKRNRKKDMKFNILLAFFGFLLLFAIPPLGLLLIVLGIGAALWEWYRMGDSKDSGSRGKVTENYNTPMKILKTRLAKGEITENEYERLKKKVKG